MALESFPKPGAKHEVPAKPESAEQEREIDLEKVGQDFAELAKEGKYTEMLVLRKQLNIPDREIIKAFTEASGPLRRRLDALQYPRRASLYDTLKVVPPLAFTAGAIQTQPTIGMAAAGLGMGLGASIVMHILNPGIEKSSLKNAVEALENAKTIIRQEQDYETRTREEESAPQSGPDTQASS
jgi:hypothetical protein